MLDIVSYAFLGLGLAVLFAVIAGTSGARASLVNLRTIVIFLLWVQYHLSPWLYLLTGSWDDWMLAPEFLNTAIGFSALAMVAVFVGYGRAINNQKYDITKELKSYKISKTYAYVVIIVCMILSMSLFIISIGPSEFVESSFERGADQWIKRDFLGQIIVQLSTLSVIFGIIAVALASYSLVVHKHSPIVFELMIIIVGLIGSVSFLWKFSRVSGALLIIAAILILVLTKMNIGENKRQYRNRPFVLFLIALGVYMSFIGITHRDIYPSGVQPYLVAVTSPTVSEMYLGTGGAMDDGFSATSNFLDSGSPFSRSLAGNRNLDFSFVDALVKFFGILQPLPSGLLGVEATVGMSVTDILGTRGQVGLTTPALAELFLLFGWPGAIVMLGFGRLLKFSDQQAAEGRLIGVLGLAVLSGAVVVSGHSGLRAMARLGVGMLILFVIFPGKSRSSVARAVRRQKLRRARRSHHSLR